MVRALRCRASRPEPEGCIAQLVEQLTLNQRVVGSIPTAPTIFYPVVTAGILHGRSLAALVKLLAEPEKTSRCVRAKRASAGAAEPYPLMHRLATRQHSHNFFDFSRSLLWCPGLVNSIKRRKPIGGVQRLEQSASDPVCDGRSEIGVRPGYGLTPTGGNPAAVGGGAVYLGLPPTRSGGRWQ
jgi:hypothetical protein